MNADCIAINDETIDGDYILTVSAIDNANLVLIENFFGSGQDIQATLTSNGFTFTNATLDIDGDDVDIEGSGTLNGGKLSLNYDFNYENIAIISCTDEGEKR